jgi:hypothetical protein
MTISYTPQQTQFNTATNQRILHQNSIDSKVYLSRTSNYLLKAIGDDLVLSGFDLTINSTIDLDTISITISPGLLIQDTTLINITEATTLTLNIKSYDHTNGYIIVYTDYQFLNSTVTNDLNFKIAYITASGDSIYPTATIWDPNRNRIVLYRFSFVKLPEATLTQILEPNFEIFNNNYYLFGETNFTNFSLRLLDHAVNASTYGYASTINAGHMRVGSNLSVTDGTVSVQAASQISSGVTRFSTPEETILMESTDTALAPASIKDLILNLKDIEIQVTDPGITLGTALILS